MYININNLKIFGAVTVPTPSGIEIDYLQIGESFGPILVGVRELSNKNYVNINACLATSPYRMTTLPKIKSAFVKLNKSYNLATLREVLKEINATNHTRLSDKEIDGRLSVIFTKCPTLPDLQREIKTPLTIGSTSSLFYDLCGRIGSSKIHVSFASKFYFYANKFLNHFDDFSKYDKMVAEKVAIYEELYCGSLKRKSYVIPSGLTPLGKFNAYIEYIEAIGRVLSVLKKSGTILNRDQFDNIVWYTI